MNKTLFPSLFFGFGCLLIGLNPVMAADSAPATLQQAPADLLGGEARAVCYSGYRRDQHPDRGAGAVNPSDAEILEDLQIILRHGFSMIRLYDSRENSAAVLRLIENHQLDLKVLLGAWRSAEVNNPGCPWQKEPYPDELLASNKRKNQEEVSRTMGLAKEYSAFDESWKGDPGDPSGAEKHWGIFKESRVPKLVMKKP